MSDVTQPSAPPPSAPSAPMQAEVPINEAPVSSPSPIGDQAPPKPPGQESNKSSHIGRREALQNAFDRAKQAQEEAAKDPTRRARPGMGHNQPPEAMERAEPPKKAELAAQPAQKKAEQTDPDAAPSAQPSARDAAQRYREGGKFARDPAKPPAEQPSPQQGERQQIRQLDQNARYRDPPQRFSDQARTEWAAAPESVRGAVHNMVREFQGAYEKYRGDHETMETLRPYHDLTKQHGTTLRKAFDNYYGMEQKLRQDLIGGLDIIVQNMRLTDPNSGRPITLPDIAAHVLSMTPEQRRLTVQQNQQTAADMRIGQLHQQVEQQSQMLGQLLYQQKFAGTRAEVDKFAAAHPRFDELADLIKSELDLGFPLEVAYQRADRLRPSTAAQTRTTTAQTRKTSISGAPDGGNKSPGLTRPSDGRQRTNGEAKHPTRREALAKAMRRVGNGM